MAHLNKVAIWERADGGVSITYFDDRDMAKYGFTDEDQFIAMMVAKLRPDFDADPTLINKSDIPVDKKDREHWSLKNNKVEADQVKKQAKESAKAQKESEKAAILAKLKISKEEFEKIKSA